MHGSLRWPYLELQARDDKTVVPGGCPGPQALFAFAVKVGWAGPLGNRNPSIATDTSSSTFDKSYNPLSIVL